jgi:cell division protein FtsL
VVSVAAGVGIAYLVMKPPPPPPPPPLGIQRLNQLATAKQTIQVVVTEKQNAHILRKPLPEFLTGERVLLVAVGNVEAGINMDEVDKEDVHVVGKKVTIDLPDAKILSSSLDEDKTRLYDRDRGLLKIRGNDALLDKARRDAEDRIVDIAKENGIVEQAQNNAKDSIRTLLLNSGYKKVVFV